MKRIFLVFIFISFSSLFAQRSDRFDVINLSEVNTKNNEFGTILTNDGSILYLKSFHTSNNDISDKSATLYKSILSVKNKFSKGKKFPIDAVHAVFTKDGKSVFFSKKEKGVFQLYKANIDFNGRWKEIKKLTFNQSGYTFKHPTLNLENNKLFFVSDRSDSYGETDIYYVTIISENSYSEPIHLGKHINTRGSEIYPFIGENNNLYFSSNRHNSIGGFDVFESFYDQESYASPLNIGVPINGPKDDFAYVKIGSQNKGYFSSNRIDGFGGIDIYYFTDKKPKMSKCDDVINGIIRNKVNKKPIYEVTVELWSPNEHMSTSFTNTNGEFLFDNVECGVRYDIVSYKEGFYGFAEVQTKPEQAQKLFLYLDPESPEEFEEEFVVASEMTVIDTQTNEVMLTDADRGITKEKELTFAEKRDLAEREKKEKKRKKIAAEKEAEKIEKEKREEVRIAALRIREEQIKKEIAKQKERAIIQARILRKEQEDIELAENQRIEEEINTKKKARAEQRRRQEERREIKRKKRVERARLAQLEKEKQIQADKERIAQEQEERKRIALEKQAEIAAIKEIADQERKDRIAQAQATAVRLQQEKEANELAEKKQIEAEIIAQEEAELAQKQRSEEAREKVIQEKIDTERLAQAEREQQIQAEKDRIVQEQEENKRIALEKQNELIAQRKLIDDERKNRIAQAQKTAEKLRIEKENATISEQEKIDQEITVQNEIISKESEELQITDDATNQFIATSDVNMSKPINEQTTQLEETRRQINEERRKRIAEAQATSKKLRKDIEKAKEDIKQINNSLARAEAEMRYTQRIVEKKEKAQQSARTQYSKNIYQREKQAALEKKQELQENIDALSKEKQEIITQGQEREKLVKEAQIIADNLKLEIENEQKETIVSVTSDVVQKQAIKPSETTKVSINNEPIANNEPVQLKIETSASNETDNTNDEETQVLNNPNRCSKNIHGAILSSVGNKPIKGANVDIYFDGQNIESATTDTNGVFHFLNVECDTEYTLISFKKDYNNIAKAEINSKNLPDQIVLLLDPNPEDPVVVEKPAIEESVAVVEEVIKQPTKNTITKKPKDEQTEKITINELIEVEDEVVAQEIRPIREDEIEIKNIPTNVKAPNVIGKKIKLNPIYFDLDEWYLTLPARRELDKIIVLMYMNKTMIIESGSHTDTRGGFDYNLDLSEKRSQETVGYLLANGVDPDRISGRGYGESIPLNHCKDGVKCSEKEHLINRRTEFIILKR